MRRMRLKIGRPAMVALTLTTSFAMQSAGLAS
jgi:hypothetical protein